MLESLAKTGIFFFLTSHQLSYGERCFLYYHFCLSGQIWMLFMIKSDL